MCGAIFAVFCGYETRFNKFVAIKENCLREKKNFAHFSLPSLKELIRSINKSHLCKLKTSLNKELERMFQKSRKTEFIIDFLIWQH